MTSWSKKTSRRRLWGNHLFRLSILVPIHCHSVQSNLPHCHSVQSSIPCRRNKKTWWSSILYSTLVFLNKDVYIIQAENRKLCDLKHYIHRGFFSNLMSSLACWDSNSFSSASALSTAWLIFSRAPIALGIKLDCLLASCKNTKKKLKKNFAVEAKLRRLVSSLPIYLFIWESAQNLSVSIIDEYKLRSEIRLVSASLAYETRCIPQTLR